MRVCQEVVRDACILHCSSKTPLTLCKGGQSASGSSRGVSAMIGARPLARSSPGCSGPGRAGLGAGNSSGWMGGVKNCLSCLVSSWSALVARTWLLQEVVGLPRGIRGTSLGDLELLDLAWGLSGAPCGSMRAEIASKRCHCTFVG